MSEIGFVPKYSELPTEGASVLTWDVGLGVIYKLPYNPSNSDPLWANATVGEAEVEGGDPNRRTRGRGPAAGRSKNLGQADLRGLHEELQHEQMQSADYLDGQDEHAGKRILLCVSHQSNSDVHRSFEGQWHKKWQHPNNLSNAPNNPEHPRYSLATIQNTLATP